MVLSSSPMALFQPHPVKVLDCAPPILRRLLRSSFRLRRDALLFRLLASCETALVAWARRPACVPCRATGDEVGHFCFLRRGQLSTAVLRGLQLLRRRHEG